VEYNQEVTRRMQKALAAKEPATQLTTVAEEAKN